MSVSRRLCSLFERQRRRFCFGVTLFQLFFTCCTALIFSNQKAKSCLLLNRRGSRLLAGRVRRTRPHARLIGTLSSTWCGPASLYRAPILPASPACSAAPFR